MEQKITKGCEIEVYSEDEGLKDAWYRAVLQEHPTKYGRKKLRVRYMTLLDEDGVSPLIEIVSPRFIRPVPPDNLYNGVVLDEGSVVDADYKDGWWTGVVLKKLENDKFLVYYDSTPDIIQFQWKQLRPHFDWIGSKWVRSEAKELSKSLFSCGTMVEVSCKIDELGALWIPALVVNEIEEDGEHKFIVKCCNMSLSCDGDEVKPNITVDKCNVRPVPPPCFVEQYELLDRVDACHGSGWRQGLVKGVLSKKQYLVSFMARKESVFKHSDLRPLREWDDGVWHQGPKRKPVALDTTLSEINELCRPKKLKTVCSFTAAKTITPASLSAGGNAVRTCKRTRRHTKTSLNSAEYMETANESDTELCETVATMELPLAQESGNQMADDVRNGNATPVITPQVIPIEMESAPPVTLVINATLLKEPKAETQEMESPEKTLQPKRMQNGLGIESNLNEAGEACSGSTTQITRTRNDLCDSVYDQPLSASSLGGKSFARSDKSKLSPDQSPNAIKNSAADETGANEDTTMVLPFEKHSSIWKVVESMEVFKAVKQSPHFSPLLEKRETLREGLALGMMVNFSWLLERVKDLQIHVLKSTLEILKEGFSEQEKYGFNVTAPLSRIDMLLSLKDKHENTVEKLEDKEKEMAEGVIKKKKVEEDLRDVEDKILELQSQKVVLGEKKVASGKEIVQMQLCASALEKNIEEMELEFQSIVSAPW